MDVYKSRPISNMGPGQGNLKDLGLWGLWSRKNLPQIEPEGHLSSKLSKRGTIPANLQGHSQDWSCRDRAVRS